MICAVYKYTFIHSVSLLWIFNLKKSSKQWTESIRFGEKIYFFFIFWNLKNVDPVMLRLFPVLNNTAKKKKRFNATCKFSEYKYKKY